MEVANRKLIEIDLRKPNKIPKYEFLQGDTNIIEIEVLDNIMRANLSRVSHIILNLTRRDNRTFSRLIEADGNVITLHLTPTDMEIVGTCDIVLQFFDGEKRISTAEFQISIKKTVNPDFNFEEGELGLVNQLFDKMDSFNERLEKLVIEGGGTPLSSSLTSTSETTAATSKAVKELSDRLASVQNNVSNKVEKSYVDDLFGQIQEGSEGKSAYEIAVDNGFVGTEQQWIDSLKGQDGTIGIDGKSAYQSWLDLGNTGTEQDFINSLKGEDGEGTSIPLSSSLTSDSETTAANSKAVKDLNDKIISDKTEILTELNEQNNSLNEQLSNLQVVNSSLLARIEALEDIINNSTPPVTNTSPSIISTFNLTSVNDSTSITIPYTVTDAEGGNMSATYTKDGTVTTANVNVGTNTWNVGTLSTGNHVLKIKVTDTGGLTSNELTFNLTVVQTEVPSTNTAPILTSSFNLTTTTTETDISIPYSVVDSEGGTITTTLTKNGESTNQTISVGSNVWNVGLLTEGSHTLSIQVRDNGGLTSNTLNFVISVTPVAIPGNERAVTFGLTEGELLATYSQRAQELGVTLELVNGEIIATDSSGLIEFGNFEIVDGELLVTYPN